MGIRAFFERLRRAQGGNAAMLVGLGLPVLVGGTGYAVDTAQWYLWKRELQYAVDQAAIAGAWAKAQNATGNGYVDRAQREYDANIALVTNFDSGAQVSLENYDGGTNNSVRVTATATGNLPFASYIMGTTTTVRATALAIHEPAVTWNPCLLALDEDESQAVRFNGGPTVNAACGVGSLSDAADSIAIIGNSGTFNLGYVITAGGFSDPHGRAGSVTRAENMGDLADPHEGLTPPDNPTPRTLTCPSNESNWTADKNTQITQTYSYWTRSQGNYVAYTSQANPRAEVVNPATTEQDIRFTQEPTNPDPLVEDTYTEISGRGNDRVYERERRTTTITYTDKNYYAPIDSAMQPGTYSDFTLSCDTTLAGGIYVINGGNLKVNAQYSLTGTGVMFVLLNGAGLEIAGGATINLSAMQTVEQLVAAGVAADQAERMKGMLIFEDPEGPGNDNHSITGNSGVVMNGIVYLPESELKIAGSMRGTSTCLELAAGTLDIGGDANLATLCPANVVPRSNISTRKSQVRLVG
ncbi:TadE/TadG family type IV pilus assembly protein [Parerythrobacter aurantius]|uniref:pilus assembly protein TadG-related protein n=1 Tax=Parerythrobacter aurantius TaxID=3127706 RepID=UPI00324DA3E7